MFTANGEYHSRNIESFTTIKTPTLLSAGTTSGINVSVINQYTITSNDPPIYIINVYFGIYNNVIGIDVSPTLLSDPDIYDYEVVHDNVYLNIYINQNQGTRITINISVNSSEILLWFIAGTYKYKLTTSRPTTPTSKLPSDSPTITIQQQILANISKISEQNAQLTTNIKTLSKQQSEQQKLIEANIKTLNIQQTQIGSNERLMAKQQTTIASNTKTLNSLISQIGATSQTLERLQTQLNIKTPTPIRR